MATIGQCLCVHVTHSRMFSPVKAQHQDRIWGTVSLSAALCCLPHLLRSTRLFKVTHMTPRRSHKVVLLFFGLSLHMYFLTIPFELWQPTKSSCDKGLTTC